MGARAAEVGKSPIDLPLAHLIFLLEKVESLGFSSTALLRQCRFSFDLTDLQSGRILRLAPDQFARIRRACTLEIRRLIAPEGARPMSQDDFKLMCHSLVTSVNLLEVLERLSRFFELCDRRHGWMLIRKEADRTILELSMGPLEACWNTFFTINAFSALSKLFDWLIGMAIPIQFTVSGGDAEDTETIAKIFQLKVEPASDNSAMVFPSTFLENAVVRQPHELQQFLQIYPFDFIAPTNVDVPLSKRVSALISRAICTATTLPSQVAVAAELGMANATFRRHLDHEGTSFRLIRDGLRQKLAQQLLSNEDLHLDEIASSLGFGSVKSFTRAYLGWYGLTPMAHRCQMQGVTGKACGDGFVQVQAGSINES